MAHVRLRTKLEPHAKTLLLARLDLMCLYNCPYRMVPGPPSQALPQQDDNQLDNPLNKIGLSCMPVLQPKIKSLKFLLAAPLLPGAQVHTLQR